MNLWKMFTKPHSYGKVVKEKKNKRQTRNGIKKETRRCSDEYK
jgi:hypothetical protein